MERTLKTTRGNLETRQTSYQTFLNIFTVSLCFRFPNVTDISLIDIGEVKNVAEFSLACTPIALQIWDEFSVQHEQVRRSA